MQQASLEFWRIYIIFNELLVFNAITSPALAYRFIALNTANILELLNTIYIVCVYLTQ